MQSEKIRIQQGFTLIELLIVMAIIGMLAALVGPNLIDKVDKGKVTTATAQIKNLENAIISYKLDVGKLPKTLEGLRTNDSGGSLWDGPYLKTAVPKDPWGNDYIYHKPGQHKNPYDLYSKGADGVEGGEGDNKDIVNW